MTEYTPELAAATKQAMDSGNVVQAQYATGVQMQVLEALAPNLAGAELIRFANRAGLYDAADVLKMQPR